MRRLALATLGVALLTSSAAHAQNARNMPAPYPWFAAGRDSTSHFNGGATDSVVFAGPVHGRKLAAADAKTVPIVFDSNPALKKVGDGTIGSDSGAGSTSHAEF